MACKDHSSLSRRQKNRVFRYFLNVSGAPTYVLKFAVHQWPCDASEQRPRLVLKTQTVLLTYQGDWGVLDLSSNLPLDPTPNELSSYVEKTDQARNIWTAFKKHSEHLAKKLHATYWTCCLEICLRTFQEENEVRLHAHLFLKSEGDQIRCEDSRLLLFLFTSPHVKDMLWGKRVSRSNWSGAYYCLAPKLGSIFRDGSIRRFRDFPIDPSWVFNMVEAGKITYTQARSELILCGKGLTRRLADLDLWHRSTQAIQVNEMVLTLQAASRQHLQAFPRWPIVDAWLTEVMKPLQTRKKCLVLHGPSRTGKTEFVRALWPLGAVFELNCANLKDICLEGFDCLTHRAILWDEASAVLVARNRKVFQHPLCAIDLGHSPTGQHVQRYFLGHTCSVITTNTWHDDVKQLSSSDQEWLSVNTVVFHVEQRLWQILSTKKRCCKASSDLVVL